MPSPKRRCGPTALGHPSIPKTAERPIPRPGPTQGCSLTVLCNPSVPKTVRLLIRPLPARVRVGSIRAAAPKCLCHETKCGSLTDLLATPNALLFHELQAHAGIVAELPPGIPGRFSPTATPLASRRALERMCRYPEVQVGGVPPHETVSGKVQPDAVNAVKARTTAMTTLLLARDIELPPSSKGNLLPDPRFCCPRRD